MFSYACSHITTHTSTSLIILARPVPSTAASNIANDLFTLCVVYITSLDEPALMTIMIVYTCIHCFSQVLCSLSCCIYIPMQRRTARTCNSACAHNLATLPYICQPHVCPGTLSRGTITIIVTSHILTNNHSYLR